MDEEVLKKEIDIEFENLEIVQRNWGVKGNIYQ